MTLKLSLLLLFFVKVIMKNDTIFGTKRLEVSFINKYKENNQLTNVALKMKKNYLFKRW